MAKDRTNMVSLLDIGSLMGGKSEKLAEMGDGFTELSEDWGPNTESTQYVNMKKCKQLCKRVCIFNVSRKRTFVR